jgi:hypothetical protein
MIHWIPTGLSQADKASVSDALKEHTPISGGGGEYELVDSNGDVMSTVNAPTLRDAGVYFINTTWPDGIQVASPYVSGVPVSVRDAVVNAVEAGDLCTCPSKCTDTMCDPRAFKWAHEYVAAYEKKSIGTDPPEVMVRYGGEVHTFTPTLIMVSDPTPDAILDGVIAKMQIKVT